MVYLCCRCLDSYIYVIFSSSPWIHRFPNGVPQGMVLGPSACGQWLTMVFTGYQYKSWLPVLHRFHQYVVVIWDLFLSIRFQLCELFAYPLSYYSFLMTNRNHVSSLNSLILLTTLSNKKGVIVKSKFYSRNTLHWLVGINQKINVNSPILTLLGSGIINNKFILRKFL